jgi:hypothetical protein
MNKTIAKNNKIDYYSEGEIVHFILPKGKRKQWLVA